MSQIHRVIVLNKPLKIRGFTVGQWIMLALLLALSFATASGIPKEWKMGSMPTGILLGIILFCAGLPLIMAPQMKPPIWWKNLFLYNLRLVPTLFLPHPEESTPYLEQGMIETKKSKSSIEIKL